MRSLHGATGMPLLFSKIWRPLCSLFGGHGCFLFFNFTLASGVFARAGVENRLMEATLTVFPLAFSTEPSLHFIFVHSWILFIYSPYSSDQCHLLHARLFRAIYAILFSPTVHLSCSSRPGWVINREGIFFSVFSIQMSTPLSEILL